jgi:hypothetical protein
MFKRVENPSIGTIEKSLAILLLFLFPTIPNMAKLKVCNSPFRIGEFRA